jgi:hypothetical protein
MRHRRKISASQYKVLIVAARQAIAVAEGQRWLARQLTAVSRGHCPTVTVRPPINRNKLN